ncbi:hypothetical protein MTR_1g057800 [Medicago truncatula]|uniref:Uncharacterized protein n=1 Tax=Medicago truncatula TaxID=3880 RepID=A0A072VJH6_MEDTR|nr:hypothetical protein MTR_1g057800 [Medicago truncatula]
MKVWDSLQTHQEATLHVRETRIDIVVRKFEIFLMEEDLKIMDMDEMIGTLRTHGVLLNEDKPIRKGKMIAFKSSEVQKEASNKYEIIEISKDQQLCEKEAKDELYLISKKI